MDTDSQTQTDENTGTGVLMDIPSKPLVQYVMDKTEYNDPDFVAASIIAARYDDPNVPYAIYKLLRFQED